MTTRNAETKRAKQCQLQIRTKPFTRSQNKKNHRPTLRNATKHARATKNRTRHPSPTEIFQRQARCLEGERKETSIDLTSNGLNNRPRDQIQQPLPDLALHIERADKIRIWA